MPKLPAKKEKKMNREDYEAKIQELEAQAKDDEMVLNEAVYRKEILTAIHRIAAAVESSSPPGGEPNQDYLPETPQPEPIPDDEEDF